MHSTLVLSTLLTLTSAVIVPIAARAPSGKEVFKRESQAVCWTMKDTMTVEAAEKILCTLKEKAQAGEECCAAGQGQDVACATDPAEEGVKKEGENDKKQVGGENTKRDEAETVNGLYINAKTDGQDGKCVKSEVLVDYLEKMIESCQFEAKKGEEEGKGAEGKGAETKDSGEKMKRTDGEKKDEEGKQPEGESMKKMVGGWQDVSECKDLYISLHSGPAQCAETSKEMGKEEGKQVS